MNASDERAKKRKRDWLDWGQGIVTLLTALLAIWINLQQQTLKSQQASIDLQLKKESETTVFTDKILEQVNALSEADSKIVKGTILLELMGLDIKAHLLSRIGQDGQVTDLEAACKEIPSRIALFTANTDALDAREENKLVEYAYYTDNRIARHTALRALGWKALQSRPFSPAGPLLEDLPPEGQAEADLLGNRLGDILKLSDNLASPDLAVDALDSIARLAERCRNIAPRLKGTPTINLILQGMRGLQDRPNLQIGNGGLVQAVQDSSELEQQLHDQETHVESTWKSLIDTGFCVEKDRQPEATISSTA
ncbi:MAG TPA: hypothetical protein VHS80_00445, partial [Chthoniobacterales bacterium]|nr:hypothetical protein [Chthoniobacterales bacterium]